MENPTRNIVLVAVIALAFFGISGWQKQNSQRTISDFLGPYCEMIGGFQVFDEDGERMNDFEALLENDCRDNGW